MVKDYYKLFGISRDADQETIRRAYRREIWKVHPDVAVVADTDRIYEIQEAYEVLSDPEKRKGYNEQLAARETGTRTSPLPWTALGGGPEPLIPEPISPVRDFLTLSHPVETLFERFYRNFTGFGVPKAERPEGLLLELLLSPDEALRGGRVSFAVPVLYPCPLCDGTGRVWPFACSHCHGKGSLEDEETISLDVPPGITSGAVFEIPLRGFGIRNFFLRVMVRIERAD